MVPVPGRSSRLPPRRELVGRLLQGGCTVTAGAGPFVECACCGWLLGRDGECANPWCDLFSSLDEETIGKVAVAASDQRLIPYALEPLVEFCQPIDDPNGQDCPACGVWVYEDNQREHQRCHGCGREFSPKDWAGVPELNCHGLPEDDDTLRPATATDWDDFANGVKS